MIGSSRASLAVVRDVVTARYGQDGMDETGRELLQIADLVGRDKPLRGTLADSGRPSSDRTRIMHQLLDDRTRVATTEIAAVIGSQRWSSESDLVDAFEFAGAEALFGAAEQRDELDRVEDELFRFGRIVSADGGLQLALSSPALPAAAKQAILSDLLGDRAAPITIELLAFVAVHLRGRRVDQAIESLTKLAAERRGKLVATVRAARPLEPDQETRLAAALERIYHQPVAINTELDPTLLGGITVQIGDEVIDGSVGGRLEAARRRLTG